MGGGGSNRPNLQSQIDELRSEMQHIKDAISELIAAHLPAMQAIENLGRAAQHLNDTVDQDE